MNTNTNTKTPRNTITKAQCNVCERLKLCAYERSYAINAIIQARHPRIRQEEETLATKTTPVNVQSKKRPSWRQMQ